MPGIDFSIENGEKCGDVNFLYPRLFSKNKSIKAPVLIELGPRAISYPSSTYKTSTILLNENNSPYYSFQLKSITKELIFVEKLSILHSWFVNASCDKVSSFDSRHIYDLYCFWKIKDKLNLQNINSLIESVVFLQTKIFQTPQKNWTNFKVGSINLIPNDKILKILRDDYSIMKDMIYHEKPQFDEMIKSIKSLEVWLNGLKI